jgi:hypothetical protein
MTTIAIAAFLILAFIAALHVAWGFGVRFPARDERSLVALVIGATGKTKMPSLAECLAAAAAIFAAGLVALAVGGILPVPAPRFLVTLAGAGVTAVFAGRGIAAYVPAWRSRFRQQPFASMDRSYYGPLCLVLAVAIGWLTAVS